jgi:hypothetical protein
MAILMSQPHFLSFFEDPQRSEIVTKSLLQSFEVLIWKKADHDTENSDFKYLVVKVRESAELNSMLWFSDNEGVNAKLTDESMGPGIVTNIHDSKNRKIYVGKKNLFSNIQAWQGNVYDAQEQRNEVSTHGRDCEFRCSDWSGGQKSFGQAGWLDADISTFRSLHILFSTNISCSLGLQNQQGLFFSNSSFPVSGLITLKHWLIECFLYAIIFDM